MPFKSKIEQLKEEYARLLSNHVCYIGFMKVNGRGRFMVATLIPAFFKKRLTPSMKHLQSKADVLVVWDLEKDDWRSVKINSIAILKKFK